MIRPFIFSLSFWFMTALFMTALFMTACSEQQISTESQTSGEQVEPSEPIIEYIWHKAGPEFSEAGLAEAVERWNRLIDTGPYQIRFANILTPLADSEDYDFVWAILWESMEARNKGWKFWEDNQQTQWRAATSELLSYTEESAFSFIPEIQRAPSIESDSPNFEVQFQFCNYGEDVTPEQFDAFQADYETWLEDYELANGLTSYWYVALDPKFEMEDSNDIIWLHIWPNKKQKKEGMAAWSNSDLLDRWQSLATCDLVDFSGKQIRGS